MSKKDSSPYTAHSEAKEAKGKRRSNGNQAQNVGPRAARQHARWNVLREQFADCARRLVGRTAMIVLPGWGCQHSAEQFRPVHWEKNWRCRPMFILLSVGREEKRFTLRLAGATSFFDEEAKKLRYINGDGEMPCVFDYLREPQAGAQSPVLDGALHHVLFTAANNLLQELVNTTNQAPQSLALPKLVCLVEGRHIPTDHKKIDRLSQKMPEELREQYKKSLGVAAEVMSLGTRFGDAAVMPDHAIVRAFKEKRAYEDYSELLGLETANPARKILMAANPAVEILAREGLTAGWEQDADEELCEFLMAEMRSMLPLPELVSDADLLDALTEPYRPVKLSRALSDLVDTEPAAVIRALRNSMPRGAALREHVTDTELLAAARNPYAPLRVGAYSKIQVVNTEEFDSLPDYATGSFWTTEGYRGNSQLPVWAGGNEADGIAMQDGDASATGVVDCIQTKREKIASE